MIVKYNKDCLGTLPLRSESISNTQEIDLKWNNVTVTLVLIFLKIELRISEKISN